MSGRRLHQHGACGLDIGGSLTKLAVFCARGRTLSPLGRALPSAVVPPDGPLELPAFGGAAHFVTLPTAAVDECVALVAELAAHGGGAPVRATGGGASKYADAYAQKSVTLRPCDEMRSMLAGLECVLGSEAEAFCLDPGDPLRSCSPARAASLERCYLPAQTGDQNPWPYVLASLGSGLSVLHVGGPAQSDRSRVGGSSVAGGTLSALGQLLLPRPDRPGPRSYAELLDLAERGDSSRADLTVGDIYGPRGCEAIGLHASVPAASLGKAARPGEAAQPRPEDVAQSLVWMVCWNAAQLAALDARRLGVRDVYVAGNVCAGRPFPMATIANSVRLNSSGEARAVFLRREGALGALGALISSA